VISITGRLLSPRTLQVALYAFMFGNRYKSSDLKFSIFLA
jgi:hypothetical protein